MKKTIKVRKKKVKKKKRLVKAPAKIGTISKKKIKKVVEAAVKKREQKKTKKKTRVTKKKKTTKKKLVKKKKITKKKLVKKKVLKKKKRVKRKKISMEDFYRILNRVQINKKEASFATNIIEADMVENIIKDVGIKYVKIDMKTQTVFTLFPKEEDDDCFITDIDYLDDEIAEEGQIFP